MKYFLSSDDSGHDYIVPSNKRNEWWMFINLPEEDDQSMNVPEWAKRIGGGLEFENPTLDGIPLFPATYPKLKLSSVSKTLQQYEVNIFDCDGILQYDFTFHWDKEYPPEAKFVLDKIRAELNSFDPTLDRYTCTLINEEESYV